MAIAAMELPGMGASADSSSQVPTLAPALAFDHLGIIVADLEAGRAFLETSLGINRWSEVVDDEALGVLVQFGSAADGAGPVYELVAPRGEASPVSGQLTRGKGVLNHVAYRTPDLSASAAHLRTTGCFATGEPKPARAYGGALVQFWVSPLRFLIELIAKEQHAHDLAAAPGQNGHQPPCAEGTA